ncbi:MAG: ArdC family protein, partial [Sulfitobacter sp.]
MRDIYAETTNSIIKSIEDNPGEVILPWQRNGSSGLPVNIDTDNSYRGVNIVMLWCTIEDRKYSSNTFGTYKQWGKKDCQVRKGEKASPIIFYKELFVEEDGKQKKIPMLRSST